MELRLENLTKAFDEVTAVDHLNLTIQDGKLTGLLGPSGCGKSTLLYMISGLEKPTEGRIFFGDKDVTDVEAEDRGIGLVFQNYALYPHMTVEQNICFPLENMGVPRKERVQRAAEMAKLLQIGDLLKRKPGQLSGGQQQRVAIARALVKRPDVLLLDEPLSNLDAKLRLEMRSEIRRIQQETGVTTIFVTHDQEEAMSITDEIVLMKKGVIQQQSSPQQMYINPENEFVAFFLGSPSITFFAKDVKDGAIELNPGYRVKTNAGNGPVSVGIRPEAWGLGQGVEVKVEAVELRGKDLIVSFNLGDVKTCAILGANEQVSKGDIISLCLKHSYVYLFDRDTGVRLPAEVQL